MRASGGGHEGRCGGTENGEKRGASLYKAGHGGRGACGGFSIEESHHCRAAAPRPSLIPIDFLAQSPKRTASVMFTFPLARNSFRFDRLRSRQGLPSVQIHNFSSIPPQRTRGRAVVRTLLPKNALCHVSVSSSSSPSYPVSMSCAPRALSVRSPQTAAAGLVPRGPSACAQPPPAAPSSHAAPLSTSRSVQRASSRCFVSCARVLS